MQAVGIVLFALAVFWLIVGALGSLRKLPGNKFIGLRTAEVRKYAETWTIAHAVAGPLWIVAGVAFGFAGAIALRASGWMWLMVAAGFAVGLLLISIGSNLGARAAYLDGTQRANAKTGCGDGGCGCGDTTPKPEASSCCDTEAHAETSNCCSSGHQAVDHQSVDLANITATNQETGAVINNGGCGGGGCGCGDQVTSPADSNVDVSALRRAAEVEDNK
ncbi:MAG: SdpI family protein [Corynebacterium sp.]|nr:SdpI family protein [Corynebacterium sp.]